MKLLRQIQSILRNHRLPLFENYSIVSLAVFESCISTERNKNLDLPIFLTLDLSVGHRFAIAANRIIYEYFDLSQHLIRHFISSDEAADHIDQLVFIQNSK